MQRAEIRDYATNRPIVRPLSVRAKSTLVSSSGPINSLPPEILEVVFRHLTACLYYDPFWETSRDPQSHVASPAASMHSWVRITQVCKHWRTIALNSSSLWSHIQVDSMISGLTMLRRSGNALLTVRCPPRRLRTGLDYNFRYLLNEVINNIHRIETFEISVDKYIQNTVYDTLFCAVEAPSLRSLCIYSQDIYPKGVPCRKWSITRLEHLEIRGPLSKAWRPFLCSSLRRLSLESFSLRPVEETMPLLQTLSKLPLLQSLTLHLDRYTGTLDTAIVPQVSLPQLQLLEITGHLGHCVDILTSVTVPQSARIVLNGSKNCARRESRHFGPQSAHVAFVMEKLLESEPSVSCGTHSAREMSTISIAVEDSSTMRLRGWSVRTSGGAAYNFCNISLLPNVDIIVPCRESGFHLETVLSLASFRNVQSLQIGPMELLGPFGAPPTIIAWFRILARLHKVTFLRMCGLQDPLFWIGLLLPHEFAGAALRFPLLTTLELVDVVFNCPTSDGDRRHNSDTVRAELTYTDLSGQPSDLLKCLIARKQIHGSLRKLIIERARNFCQYDMPYWEAMRVADVVQWDGGEDVVDGLLRNPSEGFVRDCIR